MESPTTAYSEGDCEAAEVKIESDDISPAELDNYDEENVHFIFTDATGDYGGDTDTTYLPVEPKIEDCETVDPLGSDDDTSSSPEILSAPQTTDTSEIAGADSSELRATTLPHFTSKQQFTSEMDVSVTNIINECVSVLQQDPRGYHPFYLRVFKFVTLGKKLGFVKTDEEVDSLWNKYDAFAKQQFEKGTTSEPFEFQGEHSPYLTFLLTKKVFWQGKLVEEQGSPTKRLKALKKMEYLVKKCRQDWLNAGVTESEIEESLKYRLSFFEQVKHITYPGDIAYMNKRWNQLLGGRKGRNCKEISEVVQGKKRSTRKRKVPERFEQEDGDGAATAGQSEDPLVPKKRRKPSKKHNFKNEEERKAYWAEWQRQRRANLSEEERIQERKQMLFNYYRRTGKEVPAELECFEKNAPKRKVTRRKCKSAAEKKEYLEEEGDESEEGEDPEGGRDMPKNLSEEEKRQYRKELARLRRQNMTEEERQEESRKMRERHLKRKTKQTPEELEDQRQRLKFQRLERRLRFEALPEEEQIRRRTLNFVKTQSWLANKDKEWRENYHEKQRRQAKERRARMTPEEKERQRDNYRRYLANLSGEKLERHKTNVRKSVRRYLDKLKRDRPVDWYNKTTGWQRERWHRWLDYQRQRTKNETPEQRESRLLRYRVNQAKRRTRTQLEQEGASPEEIEERLKEVEEQVRSAPRPVNSKYKPRLGARKAHNIKNPRVPPDQWVDGRPPEYGGGSGSGTKREMVEPLTEETEAVAMPEGIEAMAPEMKLSEKIPQQQTSFLSLVPGTTILHSAPIVTEVDTTPTLILVQSAVVMSTPTGAISINSAGPEPSFMEANFDQLATTFVPEEVEEVIFYNDEGDDGMEDPISEELPPILEESKIGPSLVQETLSESIEGAVFPVSLGPSAVPIYSATPKDPSLFASLPPPTQLVSSVKDRIIVPGPVASSSISSAKVNKLEDPLGTLEPPEVFVSCPPSRQASICDECGKTFTTQFSVQLHKNVVHALDPSVLLCPKCQHPCSSTSSLWNHFSIHHLEDVDAMPEEYFPKKRSTRPPRPPNEPYKQQRNDPDGNLFPCPLCGKNFVQKCTMDDHVRRYHEGKGHYCEVCGKDQQSAAKLWRHQVERHGMTDLPPPKGVPAVRCRYCDEIVMRGYEHHVKRKHADQLADFRTWYNPLEGTAPRASNVRVQCPHCPSIVGSRLLNRHIKFMHTVRSKFPCPECGFEFKRKDHMRKHFREFHTVADIEKKLEKKGLIKVINLRQFAATCLLCQTEISSKIVLRAHFVAEHHEIFQQCQVASLPIFECTFCEEKFSKEYERNHHVQNLHSDQLFTCQHCGVFKYSQAELATHEYQHRKSEVESRRQQGLCNLCDFNAALVKGDRGEEEDSEASGKKSREYHAMLYEHVKTRHPEKFLPCPNPGCVKFTTNIDDFKNHMIRCQRNGSLNTREYIDQTISKLLVICPECKGPVRVGLLDKHLNSVHGKKEKKEYPCLYCVPRVFQDQRYYLAHMSLIHKVALEDMVELAPPDAQPLKGRRPRKDKVEKPTSTGKRQKGSNGGRRNKSGKRKGRMVSDEEAPEEHLTSGSEEEPEWKEEMADKKEVIDAAPSRVSSRIKERGQKNKPPKRKIGPKSKTQPRPVENTVGPVVPSNTTKKRRGRPPGKRATTAADGKDPTNPYRPGGNGDIEKKKRLVVSIKPIPEDTVKFYLARHVIKVEY